eukprot:402791_1
MRGTMHLRFMLNGTPFHYGKIAFGYRPEAPVTLNASYDYDGIDLPQIVQLPGGQLCPSNCQSQEMIIPFHSPWSYFNLQDEETLEIGLVYMRELGELRQANQVTVLPVTVTVYAWMSDVDISIPTTTAVLQADLNAKVEVGPVETISSAVASIAGRLEDIPFIGRFATATSLAASSLSSIAHISGWSRPVLLDDPKFVKRQ